MWLVWLLCACSGGKLTVDSATSAPSTAGQDADTDADTDTDTDTDADTDADTDTEPPPDADGDGYSADVDCDDADPDVHPDAEEIADGLDQDCDGLVDEGTEVYDDDGDGYAEVDGDCDDANPDISPDVDEQPNGVDDDCDGLVDEEGDRYLDADHYLIQTDQDAITLLDESFTVVASYLLESAIGGACGAGCFAEGGSTDGDLILGSYVTSAWSFTGGVFAMDHDGVVQFSLEGFGFPHDVVRDPADGTLIVGEAFGDVTWIAGDGSSATTLRSIDGSTPGMAGTTVNSLDLIEFDGQTWLLVCTRSGVLTMWDISVPGSPDLAWRYPASGGLDTPHGAVLREFDGQFYLVYAHTFGGSSRFEGTVGVAVMAHPADPPDYLADLRVPSGLPEFGFLRGVELSTDGVLYLTDAGTEYPDAGDLGKLLTATLPVGLTPSGETGAVGAPQSYVDLVDLAEQRVGLGTPFEARISPIP
jgi:hypothetical protein